MLQMQPRKLFGAFSHVFIDTARYLMQQTNQEGDFVATNGLGVNITTVNNVITPLWAYGTGE